MPQKGDTCVCEALLNAAYALGVTGTAEDLNTECKKMPFDNLFRRFATSETIMAGRVFGGQGAFRSKVLVPTAEAMQQIGGAVGGGHVVAVALHAKPIYDFLATRHQLTYDSPVFEAMRHAIVVRAILKNARGEVTDFVILDSSGPSRIYSVPADVMKKAYGSLVTIASRGVYISHAKAKNLVTD